MSFDIYDVISTVWGYFQTYGWYAVGTVIVIALLKPSYDDAVRWYQNKKLQASMTTPQALERQQILQTEMRRIREEQARNHQVTSEEAARLALQEKNRKAAEAAAKVALVTPDGTQGNRLGSGGEATSSSTITPPRIGFMAGRGSTGGGGGGGTSAQRWGSERRNQRRG